MGSSKRVLWVVLLALLLPVAGCGGGGGGSDDGAGSDVGEVDQPDDGDDGTPPDPVDVPGLAANGDIVDDAAVYTGDNVAQQAIVNVNVVILPPVAGRACSDADDYEGCTLSDLDDDTDGDDAFDPELRVIFTADDYAFEPTGDRTYNANMEVRGSSTRFTDQKSYRIQLRSGEPLWHNQRRLQLNKHPYDLTRIRNKVAFDLFKSVDDFTSLRTQFVDMTITGPGAGVIPGPTPVIAGPEYGLFTHVEYQDERWAVSHGQVEDSNILKAEQFEFLSPENTPGFTDPALDVDSDTFELTLSSSGDNEEVAPLLAMLDALNANDNFSSVFNQYFHPDNFRTWLAANILLSNTDTNSQNFYLYRPVQIDNFYFTPWDYDGSLGYVEQPGVEIAQPRWQKGLSNWWGMVLVQRYIRSGGVPALTEKIDTLNAGPLNAAAIQSLIDGYPMDRIAEIEASEPDSNYLPLVDGAGAPSAAEQRADEIGRIKQTLARSRAQYLANLNRPMPMFQAAAAQDGVLRLEWDPSFDIQGNAIVYDVRLSRALSMSNETSRCTQQTTASTVGGVTLPADPVRLLSSSPAFSVNDLAATSVTVDRQLAPGNYYMQVIARDSQGYCQTAFDRYEPTDEVSYDGVLAFYWDGAAVSEVRVP